MRKNTIITLEEFENRCRPDAKLLEKELREFHPRRDEWELFSEHGMLTLMYQEGSPYLIGIRFPIGTDGWRIYVMETDALKKTKNP